QENRPRQVLRGFAPVPNPLVVLSKPVVQSDLKLSEQQIKKVADESRKYEAAEKQLAQQRKQQAGKLNLEQRLELQKLSQGCDAAAARILTVDQTERFRQIMRQYLGPKGFTHPEVAKELGLTDKQLVAMSDVWDDYFKTKADT